jgi:hypothetical protein
MTVKSPAPESNEPARFRLLPLLFRRHFSPLKTYMRRDLQMVVVLNPKVATTTFRHVLLEALEETKTEPQLSRAWPFTRSRRQLLAPPLDYLDLFLHPKRYRFFGFVRNPYSRLVSAWRDKCRLDADGAPVARSMKRELPAIRQFASQNELDGAAPGSEIPFSTFVDYVESQEEGTRNHHWDTQASVLATDLIRYDRLYSLESDFTNGMSRIFSEFGLSHEWVARRLATPLNSVEGSDQQTYTRDLADRVFRIYRTDFEQFGYDRDSWRKSSAA